MQNVQLMLTAPIQYGAQPNLAFYSKPDGPADNWFELLPRGDIAGARAAIEEAMEYATRDFVYVADGMIEAGADGVDFDTTGGAGDGDFLSTLRAVKHVRERYPEAGIELGMAGEFVIGVHGELEWEGRRLAGLWPREQLEVCQDAGVTIVGLAVNIRTGRSCFRNTAYALTLIKPCMDVARIPVHPNIGEGVVGVPVNGYSPEDAASQAARACVAILRYDGLWVGSGDSRGMDVTHALAAGMGGMRTAGDLVARMQMSKGMRLKEAKEHVAGKLGCTVRDLSDSYAMEQIMGEKGLGRILDHSNLHPGEPNAMTAKFRLAELLGISIDSVERFEEMAGI